MSQPPPSLPPPTDPFITPPLSPRSQNKVQAQAAFAEAVRGLVAAGVELPSDAPYVKRALAFSATPRLKAPDEDSLITLFDDSGPPPESQSLAPSPHPKFLPPPPIRAVPPLASSPSAAPPDPRVPSPPALLPVAAAPATGHSPFPSLFAHPFHSPHSLPPSPSHPHYAFHSIPVQGPPPPSLPHQSFDAFLSPQGWMPPPIQPRVDPKLLAPPAPYTGANASPLLLANFREDILSLLELQGLVPSVPSHLRPSLLFAFSYLQGAARSSVRTSLPRFLCFEDFFALLFAEFVDKKAEKKAQNALHGERQGTRTMHAHLSAFREAMRACARLPDLPTLLDMFERSLSPSSFAFYSQAARVSPPSSLQAAFDIALAAYDDSVSFASAFGKPAPPKPDPSSSSRARLAAVLKSMVAGKGRGKDKGRNRPPPPAPAPSNPPPAPTPSPPSAPQASPSSLRLPTPCLDPSLFPSLPPLPKLSEDLRSLLITHRACLRCQGTVGPVGHMANACPRFSSSAFRGPAVAAVASVDPASPPSVATVDPASLSDADVDAILAALEKND